MSINYEPVKKKWTTRYASDSKPDVRRTDVVISHLHQLFCVQPKKRKQTNKKKTDRCFSPGSVMKHTEGPQCPPPESSKCTKRTLELFDCVIQFLRRLPAWRHILFLLVLQRHCSDSDISTCWLGSLVRNGCSRNFNHLAVSHNRSQVPIPT